MKMDIVSNTSFLSIILLCVSCSFIQQIFIDHLLGKIPWRRQCLPTPVFLPGEFHRQRSLAGYSSQGRKESDTTEQLTGFPAGSGVKESVCNAGDMEDMGSTPGLGRSPGELNATHSSNLARKFNGQRSLAGYSSRGRKELDTT